MKNHFNGKNAFNYTDILSHKFGPRNSGSTGEQKAANYIAKEFKSFGLKTHKEKHPVTAYKEKKCEFTIDGIGEIFAVPYLHSKETPESGIKAELFFCDSISAKYLDRKKIKGKILVTNSSFSSYINIDLLAELGVKAVVFTTFSPDRDPINYHDDDKLKFINSKLTTLTISYQDKMKLMKKRPKRAKLVFRKEEKSSESYNVIGELKGSEYPKEIIVVCGHYDSCPSGPGAGDNAAGTAIVMELARVISKYGSKRTIRFIAFGSEEIGLEGSKAYIKNIVAKTEKDKKSKGFIEGYSLTTLDNHLFCINLDVHGYVIGAYDAVICADKGTAQILKALACERGPHFSCFKTGSLGGSDHGPFATAEIPSIGFFRGGPAAGWMHSIKDSMGELSHEPMGIIGKYTETLIKRYVCDAFEFPFEREVPKDIVEGFRKRYTRKGMPKDAFWEPVKDKKEKK